MPIFNSPHNNYFQDSLRSMEASRREGIYRINSGVDERYEIIYIIIYFVDFLFFQINLGILHRQYKKNF